MYQSNVWKRTRENTEFFFLLSFLSNEAEHLWASGVGLRYGPPNLFNYFMNEAKYAEEVGLRVCGQAEERKEKEKNMPRRILHRAKKIYSFTCNLPNFNTQQDGANN